MLRLSPPRLSDRVIERLSVVAAHVYRIFGKQNTRSLAIVAVDDFVTKSLCTDIGPHLFFSSEQVADPLVLSVRIKCVGHMFFRVRATLSERLGR
jgi:hypothetical protein